MSRILGKALLVFLLGWLPLQASAFSMIALLCEHDPSGTHGQAAVHGHHGHGEHSEHAHHGDGGDDGSPPAQLHNCCHNLTSTAVTGVVLGSAGPAEGVAATSLPHLYSFVPEQPQPPPLAA
jgi:hypothetical protein